MSMETISVTNPRSGEVDYEIPAHDLAHVVAATKRLRAAQSRWENRGINGRVEVLSRWQQAIARHAEAITNALCIDTGRYAMAHIETQYVQHWIAHWAQRGPELLSAREPETSRLAPTVHFTHTLKPYPVVGIISPWNVPLILGLIDAIPALAAGCSILLKPSEVTPRFARPLQEAIDEVPELAEVIEIVTGGPATGQALIKSVDAVCFTGSIPTGRQVAVQAAEHFIPAFLELGGKDAALVLSSANLDHAADAILRSAAGMNGQACQSLERIYVQEGVFDDFVERLVSRAEAIQINWPDLHRGHIGPFIFPPQAAKVQAQLDDAVARGAKIRCGGEVEQHGGWWCRPTVLTNVDHEMDIMREETFGPVMPVMPFQTIEDAIRLAHDSVYGLSGAVFAGTLEEAEAIAPRLQGGAISVNDASLTANVHDVEKNSFCQSGMGGSRMGDAGLMRFLRKRAILSQNAVPVSLQVMEESLAVSAPESD